MPRPCMCGHEAEDHEEIKVFFGAPMQHCRGNTWAFPMEPEPGDPGREVPCMCLAFQECEDHEMKLWGLTDAD